MGAPNTSGSDALATRHTPGEWKHDPMFPTSIWADGVWIGSTNVETVQSLDACVANARLMGAAKDMLAALKAQEMRDSGQPNPFGHNCIWCTNCCNKVEEMRRAAIAKAESGQ